MPSSAEILMYRRTGSKLEVLLVIAPGGSSRGLIQHKGEEMGFVLEGKIELNVQGKKVSVSKGDTFFFQSHLKRGYCNTGKKEAQIVWIAILET